MDRQIGASADGKPQQARKLQVAEFLCVYHALRCDGKDHHKEIAPLLQKQLDAYSTPDQFPDTDDEYAKYRYQLCGDLAAWWNSSLLIRNWIAQDWVNGRKRAKSVFAKDYQKAFKSGTVSEFREKNWPGRSDDWACPSFATDANARPTPQDFVG